MKQIEVSDREMELLIAGIGAGIMAHEYTAEEWEKEVVSLLHRIEAVLGKDLHAVFKERDEMYDGGKE